MSNKYPQKKKCPECGRRLVYFYGKYSCNWCYRVETNTIIKPDKSKDHSNNRTGLEVKWRPEE